MRMTSRPIVKMDTDKECGFCNYHIFTSVSTACDAHTCLGWDKANWDEANRPHLNTQVSYAKSGTRYIAQL